MEGKNNLLTALWVIPLAAALLASAVTLGVFAWKQFAVTLSKSDVVSAQGSLPAQEQEVLSKDDYYNPGEWRPQTVHLAPLSPRVRYERAAEPCTYNKNPSCRRETLDNGVTAEYAAFPTGALVRSLYNAGGTRLDITGISPDNTVDYYSKNGRTWFFDKDGTVNQLTAMTPGTNQGDVIRFRPDGAQESCTCASGTLECCSNPEYDLRGQSNRYCAMFPLDTDICPPAR